MPLCGSANGCGCAITSIPADSGEINGFLPTINVDGSGTPDSPWNLTLDSNWAAEVADAINEFSGATIPGVTVTNEAGWSTTVNQCRRYGPLLALTVSITRTGADVAGGTIVGTVATLSAAARGGASASWPLPLLSTSGISGAAAPGIVTRYYPATGVVDVRNYLSTWTSAGSAGFAAVIPLDAP